MNQCKEKWRNDGVVLASSSAVRARALGQALDTDNIKTISVPDITEQDQWRVIHETHGNQVNYTGNIVEVAATKAMWVYEQAGVRNRLIVAMDTVPLLLEPVSWQAGFTAAQVKYYPYTFKVFHKPRTNDNAKLQLREIFKSMLACYSLRKILQGMRSSQASVRYDLYPTKGNRPWFEGQSELDRLRCEFELRQNYLACAVRVATGLAIYVPELMSVVTTTASFDVNFNAIADLVDNNVSPEEAVVQIEKLVDTVLTIQRDYGGKPELIPGALDYSKLGANKDLEAALQWQLADSFRCSLDQAQAIAIGAPRHTLEECLSAVSYQIAQQSCAPFPEGFIAGRVFRGRESLVRFVGEVTFGAVAQSLKTLYEK